VSDPAPVDRAALEKVLRPLGESRMLPRAAYVDPAVFEWEQRSDGRLAGPGIQ
jgi:glycine betaine catabolism A